MYYILYPNQLTDRQLLSNVYCYSNVVKAIFGKIKDGFSEYNQVEACKEYGLDESFFYNKLSWMQHHCHSCVIELDNRHQNKPAGYLYAQEVFDTANETMTYISSNPFSTFARGVDEDYEPSVVEVATCMKIIVDEYIRDSV